MNLILSAHANKLESPPTFLENSPQVQSIPGIFRNPVGNNSMTINLPSNVALVFYQDIYNMPLRAAQGFGESSFVAWTPSG